MEEKIQIMPIFENSELVLRFVEDLIRTIVY